MNRKLRTVALILAVALLTVGVAYAVYLMTSNTVNVNVTSQAALTLTVDKTSIVQGESITLTVTASDGAVCAGVAVDFKEGASTLATINMNSVGVATYTFAPAVGSHTYFAEADHP